MSLSSRLLGVGNVLGVVGVKGAGGAWKRMRLTKKTASSLVCRHGVPHVLHGVRRKRLRSRSDERGRLSLHEHGFFPWEGVG